MSAQTAELGIIFPFIFPGSAALILEICFEILSLVQPPPADLKIILLDNISTSSRRIDRRDDVRIINLNNLLVRRPGRCEDYFNNNSILIHPHRELAIGEDE